MRATPHPPPSIINLFLCPLLQTGRPLVFDRVATMEQPIISIQNVSYCYPHAEESQRPALSDITLDIKVGEFVGLVGANGSGKSTMARLLNALLLPSGGEVLIDGLLTSDRGNHDRIRETAGMVFQNPDNQIVATSVEDDIAFGLENLGVPPEEIDRRIAEAAARFGIAELLGREPHWLSGGQKQRVVLAGVVALRPRVLILDEPTSMLDPRSQKEFRSFIEELWRGGTTIVYISHLMDELVNASRIIALHEGAIAYDGPVRDFFAEPGLMEKASLEAPLAVRLGKSLADAGHELPLPLTLAELVDAVCE